MTNDPAAAEPIEPNEPIEAKAPSDPTRRHTWVIAAGFAVGALLLYGLLVATAGGDIARGTTVVGVDIGGLSEQAAVEKLSTQLGDLAARPMEVSADGKTASVPPEQLGLWFDPEATVAKAAARTFNPITLLTRLVASEEIPPVVTVDGVVLGSYLADVAASVDEAPQDGGVTFTQTTAQPVPPSTGRALDRDASEDALRAAYLTDSDVVVLPVLPVPPAVGVAEVNEALTEFAEPAMSGPIQLTIDGAGSGEPVRVSLKPTEFGPTLTMRATPDGSLAPAVRVKALREVVDGKLGSVLREPRDATWRIVNGKPRVVAAKAGQSVGGQDLSAAVLDVLPNTRPADRKAEVGLRRLKPELTTAEAKALGVTERIATFTQPFPYAAYRVTNIGRAARYIDGTVLLPGQTFSMNETAKERTVENGYTVGFVISGGKFAEELGGGVSTITTAMWHTAFYAGLERVEQRAHSFYISRYLPGLEATVAWGSLDLKFRNDAPTAVLIKSSITNSSVTITMYGTKRYDISALYGPRTNATAYRTVYDSSSTCVPQPGVSGFRIVVTRVFKDLDGRVVRREELPTTYNPANNVICRAEPAPKPKPKPSPSDKNDKPGGNGSG